MANDYQDYNNSEVLTSTIRNPEEINVANLIRDLEGASKIYMNDDSTEKEELDRAITKIKNTLTGNTNTISNLTSRIGTIPSGHTLCGDVSELQETQSTQGLEIEALNNLPKVRVLRDVLGGDPSEAITSATMYNTLKTTLPIGEVCVGEVYLTDGPVSSDSLLGILAYVTADNVTDGEDIYSRIYILASSKGTPPYLWWYMTSGWRSVMLATDYKHFTLQSSTEGSSKMFWISVDDSGVVSADEIVS